MKTRASAVLLKKRTLHSNDSWFQLMNTLAMLFLLPQALRTVGVWEVNSAADAVYWGYYPYQAYFVNVFGFCAMWWVWKGHQRYDQFGIMFLMNWVPLPFYIKILLTDEKSIKSARRTLFLPEYLSAESLDLLPFVQKPLAASCWSSKLKR